jgi:hypothetical protein
LGWYFPQEFYQVLAQVSGMDIFIICHRSVNEIPEPIHKIIPVSNLIETTNIGYDWGGYQQFLERNLYLNYDFCFFCHDDIQIKRDDIFKTCMDLLSSDTGAPQIIGNGKQTQKRDWPKTHIQSYAHSRWKPPSWTFEHDTVRGSFWATTREVLRKIYPLEVFWDRHKIIGVGAGNWSLRATCGKAQDVLGNKAFSYLSETYMTSEYLEEYPRGSMNYQKTKMPAGWIIQNRIVVIYARILMTLYMNSHSIEEKNRLASLMSGSFGWF